MKIYISEYIHSGIACIDLIEVPVPKKKIIGRKPIHSNSLYSGMELKLDPNKRYYFDTELCTCHNDRWYQEILVEFIETEIDNPNYDKELAEYNEYLENEKTCKKLFETGFVVNRIKK